MKPCFSKTDFERFINGTFPSEQLAHWRQHLRVCDQCATYLAQLRIENSCPEQKDEETAQSRQEESDLRIGLEPNVQIGDFCIEKRIGFGGMGIVYQAHQISLNRLVAIKVLTFHLSDNASAIERFHYEAQAAAKLQNPNIVSIYAEGVHNGICYYAMELVKGHTLDRLIKHQRDPQIDSEKKLSETVTKLFQTDLSRTSFSENRFDRIAKAIAEAADALDYAHENGVIHRDIKPANLMLAEDGRLMIMDFGIARIMNQQAQTLTCSTMGTPLYMSPEQIRGDAKSLDCRTDIYSLGATLYELLTLHPLYEGLETQEQVIAHILNHAPRKPQQIDRQIPADLETICLKAIETEPKDRYQTAGEFAEDLRRYLNRQPIKARPVGPVARLSKFVRRNKVPSVLAGSIVLVAIIAVIFGWRNIQYNKAQELIPEITHLIEQEKYFEASVLANEVEQLQPDEPMLKDIWPKITRDFSITSDPPQATVYYKEYFSDDAEWIKIGQTPLKAVRIPFGFFHWKVAKEGYQDTEYVYPNYFSAEGDTAILQFQLHKIGEFSTDMVWIPPATLSQNGLFKSHKTIPNAPAFLIDKYEVTNRKFKQFVDTGGYQNPSYWQEKFIKEGKTLSFEEAVQFFVDSTGQPGPATWINGNYPEGQSDYPVNGISWYEAAAYAKFQNKSLPTAYHWMFAAVGNDGLPPSIVSSRSNYGQALTSVATYPSIGRYGLYDVGGNVREWCYNCPERNTDLRCILGGAWSDPDYTIINSVAATPWDRDSRNGIRCAQYPGGKSDITTDAFAPLECRYRDLTNFIPISEKTFQLYLNTLYQYDKTPLNPVIESDEDLEYCRRQRITFDAAYGEERVIAYLYLPNSSEPPYQIIVYYPGGGARTNPWNQDSLDAILVETVKKGRAVIAPFYKGTFDRRVDLEKYPPGGIQSRNLNIQRTQDLRRSVDYLETRTDIDTDDLAYIGVSWGGDIGGLMVPVENRFKTAIFVCGGICSQYHPTDDQANFAPHITIPILMIGGKYDTIHPYDVSQKPLFDLIGTPEPLKKMVLFPCGHGIPRKYQKEYQRIFFEWLDKYLEPVKLIDENQGINEN